MYKLFRILGNGEVGVPYRADTAEEIAKHIEERELKHFYVCRRGNDGLQAVIMRVDGGEFFIRSNRMPASLRKVYDRLQKAHEREVLENMERGNE